MTAVEYLEDCFKRYGTLLKSDFEKSKEMEKKEKLINQLFIGKVSDEIGFNKTIELLKESRNAFLK